MKHEDFVKLMNKKVYIGDSVYVHSDGYHYILETRNGLPNDPSNTIALEPAVLQKLLMYQKDLNEAYENIEEET